MTLAAILLLGVVPAGRLAARTGVHRLAVDAGGAAGPPGFLVLADLLAQGVMDRVQGAVMPPFIEVAPHGALGRKVLGEVAPLAAGAQHIQDGVEHVAHGGGAGAASGVDRDKGFDELPLFVGQVAGVSLGSHTPF